MKLVRPLVLQKFKERFMSQNLAEFLKVLMIVVTFSGCLIAGRQYMLSFDDVEDDAEDMDMVGHQENES